MQWMNYKGCKMELVLNQKNKLVCFCITVCNEHIELDKLLTQLSIIDDVQYQVIVQGDTGNVTSEVMSVVNHHAESFGYFQYIEYPLNCNFSEFKNNLFQYAESEWIFQLDADEYIAEDMLIHIDELLDNDPTMDAYHISRINTVEGITLNEIDAWKWNIGRLPNYTTRCNIGDMTTSHYNLIRSCGFIYKDSTEELIHYDTPVINWPDHQCRLYRNKPEIRWENKVHEQLKGFSKYGFITDPAWSIVHKKSLHKQIQQNEFYQTL